MNEDILWLTNCPASDNNFKSELKRASADQIRRAIEIVQKQAERKTKIKALESRLRRLEK